MRQVGFLIVFLSLAGLTGCKTKADVQREQEMERMRSDVRAAKGARADIDVVSEQVRSELSRMTNYVEEQTVHQRRQHEELRQELSGVQAKLDRLEALEKRVAAIEAAERESLKPQAVTLDQGQKLMDAEKFEEAAEVFRDVIRKKGSATEVRKAKYQLAECLFFAHNYASAALEYSDYKRAYPKDTRVAEATFRQAQCFKSLNKKKEAKLFFQEVLDKHPKSTLVPRAQQELKKLK